jgi:E3 ubiquitin-protein ligase HERC3
MGAALPAVDLGPGAVREVVGGRFCSCARLETGQVKCWGLNVDGQLGLGDMLPRGDVPGSMGALLPNVDLGTGRTAVAIAMSTSVGLGVARTCALLDNGTIKCWGATGLGLGDAQARGSAPGQMGDNLPAVDLGPGRSALTLAMGVTHTCARLDNGQVKCWGGNPQGELGQGDTAARGSNPGEMGGNLPAVDLGPGRTAVSIWSGPGAQTTCASLDDGRLKCWGGNGSGVLGLGDTLARGDDPGEMGAALPAVDLGAGRTAVEVSIGSNHACARLDNGQVKCWGNNGQGQLGLGDTVTRGDNPGEMGSALPALDLGAGRTAVAIRAGITRTCARLDNRQVKCWGSNAAGTLGIGDTTQRGSGPNQMGDNLPVVRLE